MKKFITFFIKNPAQLFKLFYTIGFYILLLPIVLVGLIIHGIYVLSLMLYSCVFFV
mgnify:FL=1